MIRLARGAAFALAGLAAAVALAHVYYEVRVRQADPFLHQLAWFQQHDVRPVVLIVGDSRVATNVRADRLPPGFYNWSFPAETLEHLYLRIQYALRTKPDIRYVVIGLEDLTLSEPRARRRDVERQALFAGLEDLAEIYPGERRVLLRASVLHYLPLVNATHRRELLAALREDVAGPGAAAAGQPRLRLVCGAFQFTEPEDWSANGRERRRALAAARARRLLGENNMAPETVRVFHMLLALAERHGVALIGLRSPLSREYLEASARFATQEVAALYDAAPLLALLDFQRLYADRPDFFRDGDHLNARGAAAFTDHLVQALQPLMQIDGQPAAPCDAAEGAGPRWPYNDLLSAWLTGPPCMVGGGCPARLQHAPSAVQRGGAGSDGAPRVVPIDRPGG